MGSVLSIAVSLLIGCSSGKARSGYPAYENDIKLKSELSAKILDLDLRLKKLENDANK